MNMINKKEARLKNLLSWNRNQDTSWAQDSEKLFLQLQK